MEPQSCWAFMHTRACPMHQRHSGKEPPTTKPHIQLDRNFGPNSRSKLAGKTPVMEVHKSSPWLCNREAQLFFFELRIFTDLFTDCRQVFMLPVRSFDCCNLLFLQAKDYVSREEVLMQLLFCPPES